MDRKLMKKYENYIVICKGAMNDHYIKLDNILRDDYMNSRLLVENKF